MKYRIILFLLITAAFSLSFRNSDYSEKPYDIYSEVKIFIGSESDIINLAKLGIAVDEYRGSIKTGITLIMSQWEVEQLKKSGLWYSVMIPDVTEDYLKRQPPLESDMMASKQIMQNDNITSFGYGSMGGYYTYAEVVQKLDSMKLQFPNLITAKIDRGTTEEGRKMWMVKISDNPDINESATEPPIYFDGLIHAREPQSMASVMYFMYWLLDNYATNPEAAYLVNNREIFFVPVVNPDGYYYNQTTNPNGGGSWRKNRRNNGGSYGVDLNRNYQYKWGYDNIGSSGTPSSSTYRGPSPASEPETQSVQNIISQFKPKIGFSMHSVAEKSLNPYGYKDTLGRFNLYSEYASDFGAGTGYLYGTVSQMLGYTSNGTTRDYGDSVGTLLWVIECAGSGFWPNISEIIPIASVNLKMLKYVTWAGGDYADMQYYSYAGKGWAGANDTVQLVLGIRNKGIGKTSQNVNVTVTTSYPNAVPLVSNVNYDSIGARQIKANTTNPFKFRLTSSANLMDEIVFVISVKQGTVETAKDTIRTIVGKAVNLFFDNAENGKGNWTSSGNQTQWDTSFCNSRSGLKSFTDSRWGNSKNSTLNYFTLNNAIDLTNKANPRLEFAAKFGIENNYDYTRIQISTDNGSTWTSLSGIYTKLVGGQPSYSGLNKWVYERINLNTYVNKSVKFRFYFYTDSGEPGDGFYFDDFRVVDYVNPLSGISGISSELPKEYALHQNYPNPFNPETKIKFDLPKTSELAIKVYDVTGREIAILLNQKLEAGSYEYQWNASGLNSGVYFIKMQSSGFTDVKKMMLVK
ncbi:MAG: immune inhibitor A [Ignavibacteria bacterium]|nr:immune inhibitor A [Ignavibacteria bacterium]